MFGIIRPCRHSLGEGLRAAWLAHLCGLCLALRGDHGQFARIVTNYDGLVVSVLTEAQTPRPAGGPGGLRRTAGPCPLRGMRTASVARGEGARLAAAVSLVLASAKVRDHVADGDGALARRPLAAAARRVAAGWERAGARTGAELGLDTAVLTEAVERQPLVEAAAVPGGSLLSVTEPTETATAAAFAHTAVLASRPGNAAPLAEAGRFFGRLAHLLDAVEDLISDEESGSWNPIAATGTPLPEVRRLCDDAVHGLRLALREAEFEDGEGAALVRALLVHEVRHAVERTFASARVSPPRPGAPRPGPPGPGSSRRRGLMAGCAVWSTLFCTGQVCCSAEYEDPWTGERREGLCRGMDCEGCSDCCECCRCCNCGEGDGCCSCDCNC
ncbi:MAG TPA: DUF5685 family protein [Streptomyces sp.]|uniref:DUF5685 family protein n=1 Tax=Streptomyces sp. TaxID=1931 RepID=UPI002D5BCA85|nr:DUF5685 family protein [Streptomyces sp.]HZG04885.1 DUF5685 family protein [Streptomyces sp.]